MITKKQLLGAIDKIYTLQNKQIKISNDILEECKRVVYVISECFADEKPIKVQFLYGQFPEVIGDFIPLCYINRKGNNYNDDLDWQTNIENYSYGIPVKFLSMTNDEIKNEINKEIDERKIYLKKTIKEARAKLSWEELDALGL